jgi:glycosyltransferase involved in cell wall biosynthesis
MVSERPYFTVVVPAFNAERFLGECLSSVAGQTMKDYEVVLVDDGSTDGTPTVMREWAAAHPDRRVTIRRQENRGIGGARNAGVREARGEFVAFLDADDLWTERKLERVAERLAASPAVDLVCHDERVEDNGTRRYARTGPYVKYSDLLFKGNCLSTSAAVVRRNTLLDIGGFSEDLRFNGVEDYELWLRLARSHCRIAYVHETLGVYRVHEMGITSRVAQHCEHNLNVLEAHFRDWHPKNAYYRYLMRKRRAAALRGAGRVLVRMGRHGEAWSWLKQSLQLYPFSWKAWTLVTMNVLHVRA